MTMKASLLIQAKDQASGVFGRIAAGARKLSSAFRPVSQEAGKAGNAMERIGRGALSRFGRIAAGARKMAGDLRLAERAAKAAGGALGWTAGAVGGFVGGTAAVGITAMTGALGWLSAGVVSTGAKFEQFEAQLEGIEGSSAKARAAMDWVARFAASTPYELEEVTDAFARARNLGIDPMSGAMRSMGDAASANRKTMIDAVEAMADAQTGEFERLKEFGITSSSKGGTVAFSYIDKAGRQAVKVARKNTKDIQKAILSIWDERHGGAMIRQSKTFAGLWSNLKDAVTGFQLKIARAGIFDRIKNSLASALEWANKLADSGKLDVWAKQISDWLGKAWDAGTKFVRETDWASVATGIGAIINALMTMVGWIGKAASAYQHMVLQRQVNILENASTGWAVSATDKGRYRVELSEKRKQLDQLDNPTKYDQPTRWAPDKLKTQIGGQLDVLIRTEPGVTARTTKVKATSPQMGIRATVANRGAVRAG